MLKLALFLLVPVLLQDKPGKAAAVDQDPIGIKGMKISLKQAVLMAMDNNLDIEVARFQPLIDGENIRINESPFDYSFYGQASTQDSTARQFTDFLGIFPSVEVDSNGNTLVMGARKTIPYGAQFDLSYSLSDSTSKYPGISDIDRWNQSLGLNVLVPLLKGAGREYNETSLVIAWNTRESSRFTFEKSLTKSLFAVHQAYWALVFAIEDRRVKERSLTVAEKLRDETARKLEHGVVIKLDLTQAEAGVAIREEDILTAQATVLNTMDRLKRLVDPSLLRGDELIWPSDTPKEAEKSLDEQKAVQEAFLLALKHRPDYLQMDLQIDSQSVSMNKADRDLLPTLNVTGSAALQGFGSGFSDSRNDLFDTGTRVFGITLDFEYILGQSSARGTYNAAQLARRQLRVSRRNLEDLILVEVREAVRSILTNEKRIEATKKARVLAEEQFQAELNRKKRQVSTTFRVLDVQEDLAKAQANEMKARIDYQVSLVNLQRVTGTLLAGMNVKLRETLAPRTKERGR